MEKVLFFVPFSKSRLIRMQSEQNMIAKSSPSRSELPDREGPGKPPQDKAPENVQDGTSPDPRARTRRWLRAAVFFAGSAAFGGLAVALWDRKALAALRGKPAGAPPIQPDDDIY